MVRAELLSHRQPFDRNELLNLAKIRIAGNEGSRFLLGKRRRKAVSIMQAMHSFECYGTEDESAIYVNACYGQLIECGESPFGIAGISFSPNAVYNLAKIDYRNV